MRFGRGVLGNVLRPLISLSSSRTVATSQISSTLPFHASLQPSFGSKTPQFLLPFLSHFHSLTDTRFPKRRPSDKPRRKRASLRPSGALRCFFTSHAFKFRLKLLNLWWSCHPGPYAWVEHTTGETILPNKPNEGSIKRRNEKKRMRQRRAFILVYISHLISFYTSDSSYLLLFNKTLWFAKLFTCVSHIVLEDNILET